MRRIIKAISQIPLLLAEAFILSYIRILEIFKNNYGYTWTDSQLAKIDSKSTLVEHTQPNGEIVHLQICTPNRLCKYRADTFSSKEPETLKWIDENEGVLFDIGANIGLYSLYHAKIHNDNVYAFEPSLFNLRSLSRNIYNNALEARINIITSPLSDACQFSDFKLSNLEEGGALSAFGVDFDQYGDELEDLFSFRTLGFSLDFLVDSGVLPEIPAMIKMDVDGIEHLILAGGKKVLQHSTCRTVLIEVNEDFKTQAIETEEILTECGFRMKEKHQTADGIYNQIWDKLT